MVDPDVGPLFVQALHYITTVSSPELQKNLTSYLSPAPPKNSSTPHSYTLVVYNKPLYFIPKFEPDFSTPNASIPCRLKFDVIRWAALNNLGDMLTAVYFNASSVDTGIYNISSNGSVTVPATPPAVTNWGNRKYITPIVILNNQNVIYAFFWDKGDKLTLATCMLPSPYRLGLIPQASIFLLLTVPFLGLL